MENLHKNIQLMLEFLKALFFVLSYFLFTLMIFLKMFSIILLSADDTTLYSKCNQASNLHQQLELASELECDL